MDAVLAVVLIVAQLVVVIARVAVETGASVDVVLYVVVLAVADAQMLVLVAPEVAAAHARLVVQMHVPDVVVDANLHVLVVPVHAADVLVVLEAVVDAVGVLDVVVRAHIIVLVAVVLVMAVKDAMTSVPLHAHNLVLVAVGVLDVEQRVVLVAHHHVLLLVQRIVLTDALRHVDHVVLPVQLAVNLIVELAAKEPVMVRRAPLFTNTISNFSSKKHTSVIIT